MLGAPGNGRQTTRRGQLPRIQPLGVTRTACPLESLPRSKGPCLLARPQIKPSALLVTTLLLAACGPTAPPPPPKIPTTYRVLSGISMGAVGAAALGSTHPDRFDAVAFLGGPLDAALLLRTIDRFHLGGFCPLAELKAIAAADPASLNDPAVISGCASRPPNLRFERSQDFNHWAFTTSGGFDRDVYLRLFTDLSLAYGNLLYENPASPYAPPGVSPELLRNPPADLCANPVRVKGLYNAEYNPEGKYDAITFCDGEPPLYFCKGDGAVVDFCADPANKRAPLDPAQAIAFAISYCSARGGAAQAGSQSNALLMLNNSGRTDACRKPTQPILVALAVDLNGNGVRDWGEPILSNASERYDDVGADGCADPFEDGKGGCLATANPGAQDPNHDNFEAQDNALGTEGDWRWEMGEPYRDLGLDGVANTGDTGEGNGQYDLSSARRKLYSLDARTALRALSPQALERLSFLSDGGVRDPFNFGLGARQVHGLLRHLRPGTTGEYRDFTEVPGMLDITGGYRPWGGKWELVPPSVSILYGKEQPTDSDRVDGEGDHVGTNSQAANRVATLFNWAGARWPSLPKPAAPFVGESYESRVSTRWYDSKVLGAKREYSVFLPPGYELAENAQVRYPVLYLLHGYGQDTRSLTTATLLADAFMKDASVKLRPMIVIFPSGTCCFVETATGARDCRERDDSGIPFFSRDGWRRECNKGNFFVNRSGYAPGDDARYGDSLFELMGVVDAELRTLPAAEVEVR